MSILGTLLGIPTIPVAANEVDLMILIDQTTLENHVSTQLSNTDATAGTINIETGEIGYTLPGGGVDYGLFTITGKE